MLLLVLLLGAAGSCLAGFQGDEGTAIMFRAVPNDVSSNIVYTWSFGDGSTEAGTTVSHAFFRPGDYPVTLLATLGSESVQLNTTAHIANVLPSNAVLRVDKATVPVGTPAAFSVAASDPGSTPLVFSVSFGDGTPATTVTADRQEGSGAALQHVGSFEHAFTKPGTYTVSVALVTDDDTTVPLSSVSVTVAAVAAQQDATQITEEGSPVDFSVLPDGLADVAIASVEWTFGDGCTGTGTSTRHTYRLPGLYNVTAAVTASNGDKVLLTAPVRVLYVPPRAFALAASAALIEAGDPLNITAAVARPGLEDLTLLIDWGDGSPYASLAATLPPSLYSPFTTDPSDPDPTPDLPSDPTSDLVWTARGSHTYALPGSYSIRLVQSSDPFQTVTVARVSVSVTAVAMDPHVAQGQEGMTMSFVALPPGLVYTWMFGDGSLPVIGSSVSHTYAAEGTYPVELVAQTPDGAATLVLRGWAVVAPSQPLNVRLQCTPRLTGVGGQVTVEASFTLPGPVWGSGALPAAFLLGLSREGAPGAEELRLILAGSLQDSMQDAASDPCPALPCRRWRGATALTLPAAGSYEVRLYEYRESPGQGGPGASAANGTALTAQALTQLASQEVAALVIGMTRVQLSAA